MPVFLEAETADHFYNGYCNNVLWPLLHYIPLSMLDSQASVAEEQWRAYQDVNKIFADQVMALSSAGDQVWVQDYHLMLLPRYLREMRNLKGADPELSIGWFLHTPFCTAEMYRTLPHREDILRGVLGADLIGFHIYDYARHFHTACARVLGTGGAEGVTEGNEGIFDHASRRSISVDAFPIGIEPLRFETCLETAAVKDKIIDLNRRFDGKKVLLGIDRLDYVKGIPHKLKALESFLRAHPQWMGKVVLLQIAVPSRSEVPGYQKLRNNVHKQVSRINGEFGTLDNVPIHYLDQSMSFPELCALYFRADVMFVTSLRDGMNLVSFEFIACQKKRCGVLVLSEFAGAAQALGAGALLVNPYNTDEIADALHAALNMPRKEREDRFDYMSKYVTKHTAQSWAEKFVGSLRHAQESGDEQESAAAFGAFAGLEEAPYIRKEDVVSPYKACEKTSGRRLLVFGLLGTLMDYADFVEHKLQAGVRRSLEALSASPLNTIIVCSGRERALMNELLGDLPIWLVAENGLFFRPPLEVGSEVQAEWEQTTRGGLELEDSWMAGLKPVFRYFEARTPETLTEVQEYTMTFHFGENDFAEVQAGDLFDHLVKIADKDPVLVDLDKARVEVRLQGVSKGTAIAQILSRLESRARGGADGTPSRSHMHTPGSGGLDKLATPRSSVENLHKLMAQQAERTSPAGAAHNPRSLSNASSELRASYSSELSRINSGHMDGAVGSDGASVVTAEENAGTPAPVFQLVLCAAEVMSRDEDLFHELQELEETGKSARVMTCCVGKVLSQADFHISNTQEVMHLLEMLAHASYDPHSSSPLHPMLEEAENPESPPGPIYPPPALPSALDRLPQIDSLLGSNNALFLLDYEGVGAALSRPSPVLRKFLSLYPTALVQREVRNHQVTPT